MTSRLNRNAAYVVLIAMVVIGWWAIGYIGIDIATIAGSSEQAANFVSRMFPLNFPPVLEIASMVGETLAIVFLATLLSVLLSIPVAIWAARPTTPHPAARGFARALSVTARALPDLILAIIFLRIFGLGALGGILALGIHSVGMVSKMYGDAIEELDFGPQEAIATTGATRSQQMWAAIPQRLMPQVIATALHRFDINLRNSVLLGYVGVGGIGYEISNALRTLNYPRGMALALIVILMCIMVELVSGGLRAAILRSGPSAPKWRMTWSDKLFAKHARNISINPPWTSTCIRRVLGFGVVLLLTFLAWTRVGITAEQFVSGLRDIPSTVTLFFPPSARGIEEKIFQLMADTVLIAFAATFLGVIIAIPIGILAARNVVKKPWVSNSFRVVIVFVRGIPELILAIVFLVISGLGAVAGTLALAFGAVGLLSKLVADSIEETDEDVQLAVEAVGATKTQVFFSATIRQALPALVSHALYLLDHNIRAATLLGLVGAGGIGFQLLNAARVNQFDVVTYILILMVIVIYAIELISMWLRKAVK